MIDLVVAKEFLDVIHNADDAKLQMLLDGVIDEACQFMGIDSLDEIESSAPSSGTIPASITLGVMLLLQAVYQASPEDAEILRRAAEVKLTPYRTGWGA
ncbi:head-tail connector protein [Orrella sp. 11846]|uniref:head-tail connector protein n=1 Tax=Orrella sp. 11846 TaxID=3409913 RepID=UPI003B5C2581